VSKNGALLLNIGPASDGTIPEGDRRILETLGEWLQVNGEAIYGTRPWDRFGEGPTAVVPGSFQDAARSDFGPQDVRYTLRGARTVYAVVLSPSDQGPVRLRSLGSAVGGPGGVVERVGVLGQRSELEWRRDEHALHVDLPSGLRGALPSGPLAIKIEMAG
jgi:alpha-L-fucosidase